MQRRAVLVDNKKKKKLSVTEHQGRENSFGKLKGKTDKKFFATERKFRGLIGF